MGVLNNTCEGTSGSSIPTTNAGAPDPFNTTAVTGAGTTATWDNTHVYADNTALRDHMPAGVSATSQQSWSTLPSTPTANAYVRRYIYLTAYPVFTVGTTLGVCRFIGAAALRAGVVLQPTGELRTINSAGSTISTTTEQIPLNQWVRIEFEITGISGTTGTVACRIFSGANLETNTPDSGGSVSASNGSIGGTVDTVRWGPQSAITLTNAWDSWADAVAYSDTATPGPAATAVTFTPQRYGQAAPPSFAPWSQKDRRDANTVATPANPLVSPLDSAWQAGAGYWHLYADDALRDRRQYFTQRPLVSDPTLLTGPGQADPTINAAQDRSSRIQSAAYQDRREYPAQRPYYDTTLLATAELENELLGSAGTSRYYLAAGYWDRREYPQQRPYLSDPSFYPVQVQVGAGTTEAWWGTDTDAFYRAQRLLVSDPNLLIPPAPFDPTLGGQEDLGRRWRQAATHYDRREYPQQRPYLSDPSFYPTLTPSDPLTVAWGADGNYWHLYNRAADITDRREMPQQRPYVSDPLLLTTALLENELLGGAETAMHAWWWRPGSWPQQRAYISDPSTYPSAAATDPLTLAWGAGGPYWHLYNRAADITDRREVPAQRPYLSDPLLLATAQLENELLGSADDLARHRAWYADRREYPQQRPGTSLPDIPFDPLLAAWAEQARRCLIAATHADRRLYPQQRLYFPLPLPPPPFTIGALTGTTSSGTMASTTASSGTMATVTSTSGTATLTSRTQP